MTLATPGPNAGKAKLFTAEQLDEMAPRWLARSFCSMPWLVACFEPIWQEPHGFVYRFVSGRYPPGGRATAMVRCRGCGRLGPPPLAAGAPCLDCQDAAYVDMIEGFERDPIASQLEEDLAARWWRSYPPLETWATDPQSLLNPRTLEVVAYGRVDASLEQHQAELAGAGEESVVSDPALPKLDATPSAQALERLDWLFHSDPESTRAPGCTVVLLGEDNATLRSEIAYYERRCAALEGDPGPEDPCKLVAPSARRIDHPFKPDRIYRKPHARRRRHAG